MSFSKREIVGVCWLGYGIWQQIATSVGKVRCAIPFNDTHTARQTDPSHYVKFRRKELTDGVTAIIGITKDGKTEIQSLRFDAKKFTAKEARDWCEKHQFSTDNFEPASGDKAKSAADELEIKAAYSSGLLICASETLELLAAAGDGPDKLRNFSMVAYTGASMRLPGFSLPVVVDLAGMRVPSQRRPILRQHDAERIVGHSETVEVTQQRLKLTGVISGVHPAAQEVLALSDRGFPWGASIGAAVEKMNTIEDGVKATINGRSFTGPIYHAAATVLGEVSFVPAAADPASSAGIH